MTAKLLVRQGGGAAAEVDLANLGLPDREGVPFFDHNTSLITMGQRWEQGTAALGSFQYIDPHATHTHQFRPHASVKLIEDDSGNDFIIAWNRIEGGNDTRRRSTTIGGDEVEHSSIGLGDCNLDLRGLPFATEWVRPAEDSWDRLQALQAAKLNGSSSTSTLHRATTNITVDRFTNGHLVDATSPVDLDAKTYPVGSTVEEILMDILEEWGKGWGVTLHHGVSSTHKCLLVQDLDDLAKFTSALRISDVPSDWDPLDATAPTLEPNWKVGTGKQLENSHVISGLISIYGGMEDDPDHLYVETGEAPEDWEIWIDVYHDDLAKGAVQAERRANNVLNDRKRPYTTNRPSILLLPEQVTLITAGQAIEVKSVVMNQGALKHEWVWRRIAQITWEPSIDGRWWAHLELDRPRGSRPRSGGPSTGPTSPTPPTPGTVTTATGDGDVDNADNQSVSVPGSTGGLIAVLLTNSVTASAPDYYPVTAGPPEAMSIIGQVTHPTPPSGGNKDGEMLVVAYLANPTTSGTGAHVEWGTQAGSQFGSLKGYWTTPSTETPAVITNYGTSATASVTPTGAGAENMVLHCAGWRVWSLGDASETPVDLSSVTDDWALAYNNSAGQNDGCWFGGHLAGGGIREVNVVNSRNWVAAAIILGGTAGVAGDETEPVSGTGGGTAGTGSVMSPINHVHEHGLLSDDELHYHDIGQIEGGAPAPPLIETLSTGETDDTLVLAPDGDGGVEFVAGGGGGTLDALTDVVVPSPSDGEILTFDSGSGDWVNAAPPTGAGGWVPSSQFTAASVNASSSTPTAKTGGPAVTVTVPASGKVLLQWGATIIINSATTSRVASMPITMSGANSGQVAGRILRVRNSPATFTVDQIETTLVSGLSSGSTTFTALYACSTDNADFTDRELIVTPIP